MQPVQMPVFVIHKETANALKSFSEFILSSRSYVCFTSMSTKNRAMLLRRGGGTKAKNQLSRWGEKLSFIYLVKHILSPFSLILWSTY